MNARNYSPPSFSITKQVCKQEASPHTNKQQFLYNIKWKIFECFMEFSILPSCDTIVRISEEQFNHSIHTIQ